MPPEALHAEKGAEGENSAPRRPRRCCGVSPLGGARCSGGGRRRPHTLFWCVPGDAVVQRSVKRGAKQRGVSLHIVPITAAGLLVEQTLVYKIMLVREVDKLVS